MEKSLYAFVQEWEYVYWIVALAMSVIWGLSGHVHEKIDKTEDIEEETKGTSRTTKKYYTQYREPKKSLSLFQNALYHITVFLSEFSSSFFGWVVLYMFFYTFNEKEPSAYSGMMLLIAVVGISGYGFRFGEWFSKGKNS